MSSPDSAQHELRQAFARLLQPDFVALQQEVEALQTHLDQVETLANPLPGDLEILQADILRLTQRSVQIEQHFSQLQASLTDPQKVVELIKKGLQPALLQGIQENADAYSEAIGPIIAPSIRHQIREARADMISALYPIIGQTISRAVLEAIQELRRSIDERLRKNIRFRGQLSQLWMRLRGLSNADIILRQSLPCVITHIFLIQRHSGLLLQQVATAAEGRDMDLVSAMLTAIRDFAQDAFGVEGDELEEILFGDAHILLKSGQYAYLAIVIEGVQPLGYGNRIQRAIHELNVKYENVFKNYSGETGVLPDFKPELSPLLETVERQVETDRKLEPLSRTQKIALSFGFGGAILMLALAAFACVFTVRLLPVAFPAPSATSTAMPPLTETPLPTATSTSTPTLLPPSPTQTATATPEPTATPAPPTFLPTQLPSRTPTASPIKAIMTGNVWAHLKPSADSARFTTPIMINTPVNILAVAGNWAKISWVTEFGTHEGWVPLQWVGILGSIPTSILTPSH